MFHLKGFPGFGSLLLAALCAFLPAGKASAQTGGLNIVNGVIDFGSAGHTPVLKIVANVAALPTTGCKAGEVAMILSPQGIYQNSTNGSCTWATAAPAATIPGGSNAQCQYNNAGVFGGISGCTSNGTNLLVTTQAQNDNSTKAASTAYTDLAVSNAIAGVNPAVAVLAASTANVVGSYTHVAGVGDFFTVTATGAFTLDGIAINTIGQRVLLKNQSSALQNGVYTATVVGALAVSPVFTRALDYDTPSDINSTGAIPVQSGTVNATTSWLLTSSVTTVGTDALTYVQFSYAPSSIVQTSSFSALTDAATVTWAIGSSFLLNASLTFTVHSGTRTLNITGPANGGSYVLKLIQDGTGGEGLILGTGCTWKVSGGGAGAITLSTGAGAVDVLAFTYDGTNCLANFNTNFS